MKKRALIIDQDPEISKIYGHILSLEGHDFVLVKCHKEALELIQDETRRPNLVIVDSDPFLDEGLSFTSKLSNSGQNIPVIFSTYNEDALADLKAAGIQYILHKPFMLGDFTDMIRKCLDVNQ